MGFNIFSTGDGWYFTDVKDNGLGDKFNFGARTFASTPYGLFVGSANYYYGASVYTAPPQHAGMPAPQHLRSINSAPGLPPFPGILCRAPSTTRYIVRSWARSNIAGSPLGGAPIRGLQVRRQAGTIGHSWIRSALTVQAGTADGCAIRRTRRLWPLIL